MSLSMFRANFAVMSILRNEQLPAQGRMEMTELRARWPRYALRRRDLERSVERLEAIGLIEVDHVSGHDYVILTDLGHRSAHSLIGALEALMTWPRRLARLVQRFAYPPRSSDLRGRLMDRAEGLGPRRP